MILYIWIERYSVAAGCAMPSAHQARLPISEGSHTSRVRSSQCYDPASDSQPGCGGQQAVKDESVRAMIGGMMEKKVVDWHKLYTQYWPTSGMSPWKVKAKWGFTEYCRWFGGR
jgi:hypothetical protein